MAYYNEPINFLFVDNFRELLQAFNVLGADIEIEKCRNDITLRLKFAGIDALQNAGTLFDSRKMFLLVQQHYNLPIDVVNSGRVSGSSFQIKLTKKLSTDQLKALKGESNQEEPKPVVEEVPVEEPVETLEDVQEEVELVVEEEEETSPAPSDEEPEGINWTAMKSPTFGKNKLLAVAESLGLEVDRKMKYNEIYELVIQQKPEEE